MGGGASGDVGYPTYLEKFHKTMMIGDPTVDIDTITLISSVLEETESMIEAGNPYIGVKAYDPDFDLLNSTAGRTLVYADAVRLNPVNDWKEFMNLIQDHVDTLNIFPTQAEIDDQVTNFNAGTLIDLAKSYNRVAGPLYEQGASLGTAMYGAFTALEIERNKDNAQYRMERTIQTQQQKAAAYLQSAKDLMTLQMAKTKALADNYKIAREDAVTNISAKSDQYNKDINLTLDEARWDLDTILKASTVIGQIGSISPQPKGQSSSDSIMGAAAGVAGGAAQGFMTGGPMGAMAGGAMGLLGSL